MAVNACTIILLCSWDKILSRIFALSICVIHAAIRVISCVLGISIEKYKTLYLFLAGRKARFMANALWLGLRRSEIIALKWDDIDFDKQTIRIDEAMVLNRDNEYVVKGTKTYGSARLMYASKYIMDKLADAPHETEYIVNMHPTSILYRLRYHCKTLGISYVRLHDLRHTMASVGLELNIGDKYMMERGGWSNVQTMKKRYQHNQDSGRKTADIAIDSYFEKLKTPLKRHMQHKMQHEQIEALMYQRFIKQFIGFESPMDHHIRNRLYGKPPIWRFFFV